MYKRLGILSMIILTAIGGLGWLGLHAIKIQAEGLAGKRLGQLAHTAEQIRQDIKDKINQFIENEQNRPYTDYQQFYVPENIANIQNQSEVLARSPLADKIENELAFGYFQIEPDGNITTPLTIKNNENIKKLDEFNTANIKDTLLPKLKREKTYDLQQKEDYSLYADNRREVSRKTGDREGRNSKGSRQSLEIAISQKKQPTQVMQRSRAAVESEISSNQAQTQLGMLAGRAGADMAGPPRKSRQRAAGLKQQDETITIRIEPFVPIITQDNNGKDGIFEGQIFLLRHVQIEDRHLLQGFKLNEEELLGIIRQSAERLIQEGMLFELAKKQNENAAYSAILDFGFGNITLNLMETDPKWIDKTIGQMKNWYFTIMAIVLIATGLAMASLWRNMLEQVRLAKKKDDFIAAVSHELRTPLTSMRIYTEMLEKNWVSSDQKKQEYYGNMLQENQRLGRLIENVLDFSRIQRKQKQYNFQAGNINETVGNVLETISIYAKNAGFEIVKELQQTSTESATFDKDAVTQIVVNLVDNAIKYAKNAEDKKIIVRTKQKDKYIVIEVEDHGPGIPQAECMKIFDEFYRCNDESKRETTGIGLGLAIVKNFAKAHDGFVEINTAKPTGTIITVTMAARSVG